MKVKDLNWKDNITEAGKANGLIELKSKDEALGLDFYISNHLSDLKPFTKNFRLIIVANRMYYVHDKYYTSIEECKKVSQKVYKKTIISAFFQKPNKKITNGTAKS